MFDEFVWYAAYDQDMKIESFVKKMKEWISPDFEPFGIVPV